MTATQVLTDALQVIYREASRSPWICLNAFRDDEDGDEVGIATGSSPVLVLGGFLSHPYYYAPLGRILSHHGHAVHYDEVFNALPFRPHVTELGDRVRRIADVSGAPVRVVGHSLGGLQAAALLAECPDVIVQVVAVASPIVGGTPWRPLQRLAEHMLGVEGSETEILLRRVDPFAMRMTTISSPQDLVAPPAACAVHGAINVVLSTVPRRDETLASHVGVIFMKTVVRIILTSLARPLPGVAPRVADLRAG